MNFGRKKSGLLIKTLIFSGLLLILSCSEQSALEFDFPSTPVLSLRARWAVVSFSYLPLYEQPSIESPVIWNARGGEIFEVLEQSLETEVLFSSEEHWYRIMHDDTEGWAFGAGLRSYSSREEALNAASRLTEGASF